MVAATAARARLRMVAIMVSETRVSEIYSCAALRLTDGGAFRVFRAVSNQSAILVTGGAGYIGSHTVRLLAS